MDYLDCLYTFYGSQMLHMDSEHRENHRVIINAIRDQIIENHRVENQITFPFF
jgi:hypothetical protein